MISLPLDLFLSAFVVIVKQCCMFLPFVYTEGTTLPHLLAVTDVLSSRLLAAAAP